MMNLIEREGAMQSDLNRKIGQATKWSSLAEIIARLIAPITNAVLARLLIPEVFGVVATLTMVVSFAEIFTDAGFQKYIVQHQFKDEDDLEVSTNVAFWTNLGFSFVLWGVIVCFATPITNLVGSPGCEPAVIVMCAQIPLLAFSSIQMARYRREFDFKNLFVARVATSVVPLVVTVPLAIVFKSYWALVVGTLSRDVLNVLILTLRSKWKPKPFYSISKMKEMLSFSLWTMVENISIWLTNYAGTFIVSTVFSKHFLGLYKTTIATVNAYMSLITSASMPVLFSALSRVQDDDDAFRCIYFRFQKTMALLVFPLGFGIFAYRRLATLILLGNQWMDTADFLGLWSLTSALNIIFSHLNSEAFRSKGKPRLSVLVQLLQLIVLIPVLLAFADSGYDAITIARSLVRLEMIVVSMMIMQSRFRINFAMVLKNVWPQFVSSVVMMCVGLFLQKAIENVFWELCSVLICAVVYLLCMLLIPDGRKQLSDILSVRKSHKKLSAY